MLDWLQGRGGRAIGSSDSGFGSRLNSGDLPDSILLILGAVAGFEGDGDDDAFRFGLAVDVVVVVEDVESVVSVASELPLGGLY